MFYIHNFWRFLISLHKDIIRTRLDCIIPLEDYDLTNVDIFTLQLLLYFLMTLSKNCSVHIIIVFAQQMVCITD